MKQGQNLRRDFPTGFSLVEFLVSVAIITLLMSAVFPFLFQSQKRYQANQVVSEANQSARAAMEVMTQEIGQAGFNPNFTSAKTSNNTVAVSSNAQCVTLSDINQINPGDWLTVDTGPNQELVQVLSTSNVSGTPCSASNQIDAVFLMSHSGSATPFPVISYKMPYGSGILQASGTSSGQRLEFFGDINQDGTIRYVVYSLLPASPSVTATINGTTYTYCDLYRSVTSVPFTNLPAPSTYTPPANNQASPLVTNVLYNTMNQSGPAGQPIFAYPNQIVIGVVPNQITVVGTVVVTISVAVSPKSLESGSPQWFTLATQIRPLNLQAAIVVNNAGGAIYLPPLPKSLPMTFPSNYYP
ncbi:MAG: prepilin-type N-terminal cleavage/methylation domain-containing protein [Acidobacteria bacterium]|nr:MAG: prepilin-type N-terminal cleavage/methylation domain-containing protein [Acidobacteriota bacterium]